MNEEETEDATDMDPRKRSMAPSTPGQKYKLGLSLAMAA